MAGHALALCVDAHCETRERLGERLARETTMKGLEPGALYARKMQDTFEFWAIVDGNARFWCWRDKTELIIGDNSYDTIVEEGHGWRRIA